MVTNELDKDLEEYLDERRITHGNFLDVGTGNGSQSIMLAKRGFNVTATDIVDYAFLKISELSCYKNLVFIKDDILNTKLVNQYDYILDRGCFTNIKPSNSNKYINAIFNLLKTEGLLLLKCYTSNQDMDYPYCLVLKI